MKHEKKPFVSIIIPVHNESLRLRGVLSHVSEMFGSDAEIIIVDASPESSVLKENLSVKYIHSNKAIRSCQMNLGAEKSEAQMLLFLHADTILPESARDKLMNISEGDGQYYGAFYKKFDSNNLFLKVIAFVNNLQLQYQAKFLGDNTFFASRELFNRIGGFPEISLMEDVELSHILQKEKKRSQVRCVVIKNKVITSARKFTRNGILKTFLLMQKIRLLYFFGVSPEKLRKMYYSR